MIAYTAARRLAGIFHRDVTLWVASGLLLPAALPLGARAQAAASADQPHQLDRFAVTTTRDPGGYVATTAVAATKLPTPLIAMPQAIAVVPERVLVDQDATTVLDGIRNVSAVASRGTDAGVNEDFTVRGFRTDDRRNYFRNGIRYFNGYPAETGNLQHIEVLKGPASVLYGAVEPGGVINLVTRRPSAVPLHRLSVGADSEGSLSVRGDSSGPLDRAAHWRYRVYGTQRVAESFRDQVENRRTYVAPALTWLPSARTTIDLEFEYLRDALTPDTGIPAIGSAPAPLRRSTYLGEPYNFDRRINRIGTLRVSHSWSERLSLDSSVSAYDSSRHRYEATPQDSNFGLAGQNGSPGKPRQINRSLFLNDYSQQEYSTQHDLIARFHESAVRHTLLVGVDARRFESSEDAYDGLPYRAAYYIDIDHPVYGQPLPTAAGYPALYRTTYPREDTLGAHVQEQIELGPRWLVLAGARYDRSHFRQTQVQASGARSYFNQVSEATTPRLGLLYRPTGQISFYGSFSRSFSPKVGTLYPNTPVLPEKARQFEAGLKFARADDRLSLTLAAYEITRRQVVASDPSHSGYSVQIGEQRSRGVDLDVAARLAPGWNVIACYALIDATITADTRLPVGNRLDNAPRDSGSVWSSYRFGSGPLAGFGFGAGAFFVGRREGNLENNFQLPGYTRLDAALYLRRGRFDTALHVKNAADRLYYQNSWRRDRIMPGLPLTVSATVGVRF